MSGGSRSFPGRGQGGGRPWWSSQPDVGSWLPGDGRPPWAQGGGQPLSPRGTGVNDGGPAPNPNWQPGLTKGTLQPGMPMPASQFSEPGVTPFTPKEPVGWLQSMPAPGMYTGPKVRR